MLDLAIAIPTLVGSILSMLAAGSILLCYLILPAQKHYRHTLILNLAAADFFNAFNNTTSGIYAFTHGSLTAGNACTLNGFVGQITVQAVDFSILFISIATVITIRRYDYEPKTEQATKLLITLGIWFVPATTSIIAFALNAYQPVSGNWCWISSKRTELRYALTHGWRMTIIATIVSLYLYLFVYIHRHFSSLRKIAKINEPTGTFLDNHPDAESDSQDEKKIYIFNEFEMYTEPLDSYWQTEKVEKTYYTFPPPFNTGKCTCEHISLPLDQIKQAIHPHLSEASSHTASSDDDRRRPSACTTTPLLTRDPLALIRRSQPAIARQITRAEALHPSISDLNAREKLVQKLLFLNGYPILYVLLLTSGLANRFAELNGHHSRGLAIMQASTQYVGLANALIYGYNERILTLISIWWQKKRSNLRLEADGWKTRMERPSPPPLAVQERKPSVGGLTISRPILHMGKPG